MEEVCEMSPIARNHGGGPVGRRQSVSRRRFLWGLTTVATFGRAVCEDGSRESGIEVYARLISRAQMEIATGTVDLAKATLETTESALRGFEYDYLQAQTKVQAGHNDLVQRIAAGEVETRAAYLCDLGRHVVFICRDGALRVFELAKPKDQPLVVRDGDYGPIWCGAVSRDGTTFVAGHQSGAVVIWDALTWKKRMVIAVSEGVPVREIAVAPDGLAVVAEGKTQLELWSLEGGTPKKVGEVGARYNFGEGLAFSPKGDLVATGGMFDILIYDARTGAKKSAMRHASYTMGLEFSPDGKRIASAPRGNVNRFLGVFDLEQAKPLWSQGPLPHYVAGLAFTPDGKRLIATGPIQDVRILDVATGKLLIQLGRSTQTFQPSISRDGRTMGWCEGQEFCFVDLGRK